MKLLCLFFPCRWVHAFNVSMTHLVGVYQCYRCNTISVGCSRPFGVPREPGA